MEIDVQKYQIFQEVSAGGVVIVKEDQNLKFVCIEREAVQDVSLPKGHQEPGESLQQTATREIFEETGFTVTPQAYLGQFTYSVKSDQKSTVTFRTVHWFLMEANKSQTKKPDSEVKRVRLEDLNGDLSFLSYDNDRQFILQARSLVK